MSQLQKVAFGFLNIVATPHPVGVYERLFRTAAGVAVNFWGDQFGAITEPKAIEGERGLFIGRLVTWTEIDPNEPAINKQRLTETSLNALNFSVPAEVGFNGRVFMYVLDETTHILTLELTNEFGKSISPSRAERIFSRLLSPDVLGVESEAVEVTVVPEEDALNHVLGLARVDRIDILVKRPNADDISSKVNRIMAELDEQNVKRQEMTFHREGGEPSIELNERNSDYAEVAAENGYVAASGRNEDGEPDARSTKQYPKIVKVVLGAGETVLASLRVYGKSFRVNRGDT